MALASLVRAAASDQVLHATFAVTPTQPLMDDRLGITISGLPANRLITIQAKSRAQDQVWWRSTAVFSSGPHGTIDLGSQAPISGAYRGADGMGLFWSMGPDTGPKSGDRAFFTVVDWLAPIVTEIEAADGHELLGSVTVERRFAKPGVRRTAVAEGGLAGSLYDPGDGQRHKGVIVLGGSEGGFGGPEAAMLASHGFTALSLAYFGVKGLPPTLQNIPLEYFGKAIQWVRASPMVDASFIAVFGASRGAEAALMLAATYPEIKAVVAKAPSHVRWEGVTAKHLPGGPAWTFNGQPLPYVPNRIPFGFLMRYIWDTLAGIPVAQTPLFLEDLADFGDTAKAEIPVERINGPVLLLSGKDDQIWPSTLMAERVMDRLRRNRHPYRYVHLSYDGAGHWLPIAYEPIRGLRQGMKLAIGGTPEGTSRAQAGCWPKILDFLLSASTGRQSLRATDF
jgi:pimeloyl-ACP methyl ester carboxylesterase